VNAQKNGVNAPTEITTQNTAANAAPTNVHHVLNRSKAMHLMNEDMARAHSALRLEELLRHERSRRVVAAHRAQRRAERHVARAQRLLSLASMR